jgi:hypothetical protein
VEEQVGMKIEDLRYSIIFIFGLHLLQYTIFDVQINLKIGPYRVCFSNMLSEKEGFLPEADQEKEVVIIETC